MVRLSTFSVFALAVQLFFSAMLFASGIGSGLRQVYMVVIPGVMLLAYLACLVVLIMRKIRGRGFPVTLMKWGFTVGAAGVISCFGAEFFMHPPSMKTLMSIQFILMMTLYIFPPALVALSLWMADRAGMVVGAPEPARAAPDLPEE